MESPSQSPIRIPDGPSIEVPFSVVIDKREQKPYKFENLRDNKDWKGRSARLIVPTVRATLKTGDYTLADYEDLIILERKSKEDLYQSISQNRENFVGRLERMESFEFAAVIVEASWDDLIVNPPQFTKFAPKSLSRTIDAWMIRYKTRWLMLPNRDFAEAKTFRLLQRFFIDKQEKENAVKKT
jgi:ERCC4-type nuclease